MSRWRMLWVTLGSHLIFFRWRCLLLSMAWSEERSRVLPHAHHLPSWHLGICNDDPQLQTLQQNERFGMKESVERSRKSWWLSSTVSLSRTGERLRRTVVAGFSLAALGLCFHHSSGVTLTAHLRLHKEIVVEQHLGFLFLGKPLLPVGLCFT